MNFKQIAIPVEMGNVVLMFKQYQKNGDWLCTASDEFIKDLEFLTQTDYMHSPE